MKHLASLLLLLILGTVHQSAMACSCIVPPAPLVALEDADVVFAGKVTSISRGQGEYGEVLKVVMRVDSYWKGNFGEVVIIQTATSSAACGFPFEDGKEYLVYGGLHETAIHASLCSRTTSLENAREDLAELGEAEEVVATRSRCGGPTNAAMMQVFLFLWVGIFFMRKGKKE